GDEFFLVLQAVSGCYLDDLHFLRCGHVVSSRLAVNDTLLTPDIATVIQALNDLVKLQFCEHGGHPRECQTTAATQLIGVGGIVSQRRQHAPYGRVLEHARDATGPRRGVFLVPASASRCPFTIGPSAIARGGGRTGN